MRRLATTALLLGLALGASACAVSPDSLPRTYLERAMTAVRAHDAPDAMAELNQAEAVWLKGNTAFTSPFLTYDPTALRNIGRARVAVQAGRWEDAEYYVRTAIAQPTVVTPG